MKISKLGYILVFWALSVCVPSFAHESYIKLRRVTDMHRGEATRPKDFIPQKDGTVIDKRTGLQWMRCTFGQTWNGKTCEGRAKGISWKEAVKLTSDFAGYNDWRLPNIWELETLVYCSSGTFKRRSSRGDMGECTGDFKTPTTAQTVFPNAKNDYWTSTAPSEYAYFSYSDMGDQRAVVSFYVGSINYYFVSGFGFYVRFVRYVDKPEQGMELFLFC